MIFANHRLHRRSWPLGTGTAAVRTLAAVERTGVEERTAAGGRTAAPVGRTTGTAPG